MTRTHLSLVLGVCFLLLVGGLVALAWSYVSAAAPSSVARGRPTELYDRKGDKIVNAPPEELALARTYYSFAGRGPIKGGQRITIMIAKREYHIGEPIRVLHVLESVKPGIHVYVMGPKTVSDEYIDGKLVPPQGPPMNSYDGAVVSYPWADFNYQPTTYSFDKPGTHTIKWKGHGGWMGDDEIALESNTITIKVMK